LAIVAVEVKDRSAEAGLIRYGWTGVDQAVNSEDPSLATADEVTWGAFMDSLASALDKHHGVDTP
jgi:hypothetical protein